MTRADPRHRIGASHTRRFLIPERQRIFKAITKPRAKLQRGGRPHCGTIPSRQRDFRFRTIRWRTNRERHVDYLIEHRNHRAIELAILKAQDTIKDGGTAEEVASAFTHSVAKALSKRKGRIAQGRSHPSPSGLSQHRCRRSLRNPHGVSQTGCTPSRRTQEGKLARDCRKTGYREISIGDPPRNPSRRKRESVPPTHHSKCSHPNVSPDCSLR